MWRWSLRVAFGDVLDARGAAEKPADWIPVLLSGKRVVFRNASYFVADHQTGDTAHYPSVAQAMAAGRALVDIKLRAQGLPKLNETEHRDGCLYFVVAGAAQAESYGGTLVSVGRVS